MMLKIIEQLLKRPEIIPSVILSLTIIVAAHQFLPQAHSGGVTEEAYENSNKALWCAMWKNKLQDVKIEIIDELKNVTDKDRTRSIGSTRYLSQLQTQEKEMETWIAKDCSPK